MSLDSFAHWYGDSFIGTAMNSSRWAFPFVEVIHMAAFIVLIGNAAIINFRMLGWRFSSTPVAELSAELAPWIRAGFITVLITGPLLVATDAHEYLDNPAFWWKMAFFALAVLFDRTLSHRLRAPGNSSGLLARRLAAGTSLLLWTGAVASGRKLGIF